MSLHLITLGGLRARLNGQDIQLPAQRRNRIALLVFLAVERSVSRERAVGVFWPESPEKNARHALSQALYEVRQQFGGDVVDATSDRLLPGPSVQVDFHVFADAVATKQFDVALELYGGAFLAGVDNLPDSQAFESWVDAKRAHLERLHRTSRRNFISRCLADDQLDAAIAAAREWVRLSPLEDEAQHRTIELLAASGDTIEAMRQYQVYERLLAADGLTPLEDTKALATRIRAQSIGLSRLPQGRRDRDAMEPVFPSDLEVIRVLGEGKMATVYLAREPALKRLVAVKVLRPELSASEQPRLRFEREAQSAAGIVHANVTRIYRVAALTDGTPLIVMDFIDGRTLEDLIAVGGPLKMDDALGIVLALADALKTAHEQGIIHRDVRTGNVMVENRTDRVVLMDFGIAGLLESGRSEVKRLTHAGELLGDPARTSPEQQRGDPATPGSDVYSLGVLAFEVLTARLPIGADIHVNHYCPDAPRNVDRVIAACLSQDPQRRPSLTDIMDQLSHKSEGGVRAISWLWRR